MFRPGLSAVKDLDLPRTRADMTQTVYFCPGDRPGQKLYAFQAKVRVRQRLSSERRERAAKDLDLPRTRADNHRQYFRAMKLPERHESLSSVRSTDANISERPRPSAAKYSSNYMFVRDRLRLRRNRFEYEKNS